MQCTTFTKGGDRCLRPATQGLTCWQHVGKAPKLSQNLSRLQRLPNDLYRIIGSYLKDKDIIQAVKVKFPRSLYLGKTCAVVRNQRKLTFLEDNFPWLKNIKIRFLDDLLDQNDVIKKLFHSFRKLEALTMNHLDTYPIIPQPWNLLYLNISYGFTTNSEIHKLIDALPMLMHLKLMDLDDDLKSEESKWNSPNNLLTLELKNSTNWRYSRGYNNLNLNAFQNVIRLVYEMVDHKILLGLQDIIDLQVLEINYAPVFDLQIFTNISNNLRYLKLISHTTSQILETFKFPNLEYLGLENFYILRDNLDILSKYPNLEYIHLEELDLSILTNYLSYKLSEFLTKKPGFLLDFDRLHGAYSAFSYTVTGEPDKMNLGENWHKFQQLFNFSVLEPRGIYFYLRDHMYPPGQWLRDQGYYVKERCTDDL